jgi:hypothetical protein
MQRVLLVMCLLVAACSPTATPPASTTTIGAITTTTTPIAIGPGRCGDPLLTDERIPDTTLADELISRFVADRADGVGAEGCLSDTAAQTYASSTFPTCLYACTDAAQLVLPTAPSIDDAGTSVLGPLRSVLVDYRITDTLSRTMREIYEVHTIRGPNDMRQVLIDNVTIEPESQVGVVAGRRAIDDFLSALADGAWDAAGSLLAGAGAAPTVDARLPGIGTATWTDLLEPFCASALCAAPYEITGSSATDAMTRTFQVTFSGTSEPLTVAVPVTITEGRLTVGALPPDGVTEERMPSVQDRLFPDEYQGNLALVHYEAVQVGDWYVWPSGRAVLDAQLVGGKVLFGGFGGVHVAALEEGAVQVQALIAADPWTLAGVATILGVPTALLTDGGRLVGYDLPDGTTSTFVDLGASDTSIRCASYGGGTLLVTTDTSGATAYDLYSLTDGSLLAHYAPDKASGCGVLSPDGTAFVYTADVSLGNPQTIVLAAATTGDEIDRWSVLADAVIGSGAVSTSLVFDGRYAVADLAVPPDEAPYSESPDLGHRFVVDTQTGDQWTVDTAVQVLFPPG